VRITTQLINAATGFHLWSKTYDRDLGDVLKLQTEIATAVAEALKITLLGDISAKIELGGTRNPAAFDAYLRASKLNWAWQSAKDEQAAIDTYTEAIDLDPNYALAYAARSIAHGGFAEIWATTETAIRANLDNAQVDARKAIALAPDLSEGHLALALVYARTPDFTRAAQEYERALALGTEQCEGLEDLWYICRVHGPRRRGTCCTSSSRGARPIEFQPSLLARPCSALAAALRRGASAFRVAQALAPMTSAGTQKLESLTT